MSTGDPHNFGYGTCWCGIDHAADAYTQAFEDGRRSVLPSDSLDAAWAEAEAMLPEGWHNGPTLEMRLFGYDVQGGGRSYAASVIRDPGFHQRKMRFIGDGDTPAAALLALAERLREAARG